MLSELENRLKLNPTHTLDKDMENVSLKPKPGKPKPAKPLKPKPAHASFHPSPAHEASHAAPPPAPAPRQVPAPQQAAPAGTASAKVGDLQLSTLWFAQPLDRLQLPPCLSGRSYSCQAKANSSVSTLNINVRQPDLSVLRIELQWPPSDPSQVQVEETSGFPPKPMSQQELIQQSETFGDGVASWAEAQRGTRVGDGECWTLAKEALVQGTDGKAMPSQGYVHGALVLSQKGSAVEASFDMMRRGDIVQFEEAAFAGQASQSRTGPHHTSIITSVNHATILVVEQNVGGSPVQDGSYNLQQMTTGTVRVYRPVFAAWIEPF